VMEAAFAWVDHCQWTMNERIGWIWRCKGRWIRVSEPVLRENEDL
jgi:hypothetical protein